MAHALRPSPRSSRRLCLIALALVSLAALTSCSEEDPAAPADGYDIEMAYAPSDVHPQDVVTFKFTVQKDGAPVDGLTVEGRYELEGGATNGTIPLAAGVDPGTYGGKRGFPSTGTWAIFFSFDAGGTAVQRKFSVLVDSH